MSIVTLQKSKAKRPYKLADGTAVPGITTVLSVLNKPALLEWAWKLGMEGLDYKKVRDNAADVGQIAHFMVECWLKGDEADLSQFSAEDRLKADGCFVKFKDWWNEHGFTIMHSELEIVSEAMRCGGKLDIVALDKEGRVCLIDIKSSKAIYSEYWAQVAAYESLYEMSDIPENDDIDRRIIVRIGKGGPDDFEIQERNDLSKHLNLFLAALEVYNAQKELK